MPTFINGKIFTGIDQTTFVSAMTIEDGHVTWVGESSDITDPNAIDLHAKTVLPGLIDVHTHPKYIADALHGVACTPPNVNSIKDMQAALRQSPAFGKGPDTWIEGWGFDETKLAEHRTPTVDDLDEISTTQPIGQIATHQSVIPKRWNWRGSLQQPRIRLAASLAILMTGGRTAT